MRAEAALLPRTKGGLGIADWESQEAGLQAMWVVRYLDCRGSRWKQVLEQWWWDDATQWPASAKVRELRNGLVAAGGADGYRASYDALCEAAVAAAESAFDTGRAVRGGGGDERAFKLQIAVETLGKLP